MLNWYTFMLWKMLHIAIYNVNYIFGTHTMMHTDTNLDAVWCYRECDIIFFDDIKSETIVDVYVSVRISGKVLVKNKNKNTKDYDMRPDAKSYLCCSDKKYVVLCIREATFLRIKWFPTNPTPWVPNLSHLIYNFSKLQIKSVIWTLHTLEGLPISNLMLNPLGLLPIVETSRVSFLCQLLKNLPNSLYVDFFPHSNLLYSIFYFLSTSHLYISKLY